MKRNLIEINPTLSNNQSKNNLLENSTDVNKGNDLKKQQYDCNNHLLEGNGSNKVLQNNNDISVIYKEINKEHKKNISDGNIITSDNSSLFTCRNKTKQRLPLTNTTTKDQDIVCEIRSDKKICVKKLQTFEDSKMNCPEIVDRANLEIGNKDNSRRTKIVINPAAASASKKTTLNMVENKTNAEEKPKYQTDKIIIPTANKNNVPDVKKSLWYTPESHLSDLPKFSVKSYSSKSEDIDIHGILGVEYVIKILKHKNDLSPRYECGLCELVLDGFAMQRHLEGYNHRLKFCEKHFPTAIRHYRQYMQSVPEYEVFKVMTPILERLAKAIESHHGRNLPYECYERDFNLNRHEILAKAFSCRHASEQYGPTFTHVVGADEIDFYINSRQNYTPPKSSRFAIFDIKPGESLVKSNSMHCQNFRITDKNSLSRDHNRNRHAGRTATNYLINNNDNSNKSYLSSGLFDDLYLPGKIYEQNGGVLEHVDDKTYNLMVDNFLKGTLKGVSGCSRFRECQKRSVCASSEISSKKRKSLSPLRDNDIWQAYRHMVDQELNNLDEKFKQYRKDPEAHPSYNEEWQKFWKRRKDELISAGLDHRSYNYQPEWVKFVRVRIEELYNEEVENTKIKCRERLCLPMTNTHLLEIKYHVQVAKSLKDSLNETLTADVHPIGNSAKDLPIVTSFKVNVPQVVSVLRLMTALEDNLGSLGPKIINLLSKALQTEKSNPSQVNAVILTQENCSLLETAKEKFKALVITGLFEGSKERVFQQVINDTEDLLKYAYQNQQVLTSQRSSDTLRRTQSCTTFTERSLIEGSVPSVENLLPYTDKIELASKLAASLVAQGKTDFDPLQLQQLLAVYTLIEKKKHGPVSFSSSKETTASKKKLSDTLSDLLKSSSTATQNTVSTDRHLVSNFTATQQKDFLITSAVNTPSIASFNSVLQNSGDNYLNNSTHPPIPESSYGINTISSIYANNCMPYQQNSVMNNTYNNDLYQNNNRTAQNWMFNSNTYNRSTNWRNF